MISLAGVILGAAAARSPGPKVRAAAASASPAARRGANRLLIERKSNCRLRRIRGRGMIRIRNESMPPALSAATYGFGNSLQAGRGLQPTRDHRFGAGRQ